jgi:hypothetical protein
MLPHVERLITSTPTRSSILQSRTSRALYQGYQLLANMASHSNQDKKSEKFGHLALSTSGPQKTILTVSHVCSGARPVSLTPVYREMPSLEPHTSTRALPSQQKSVRPLSCTVSCPTTSRHLMNKFAAPTNSTSHAPATSRRTRS